MCDGFRYKVKDSLSYATPVCIRKYWHDVQVVQRSAVTETNRLFSHLLSALRERRDVRKTQQVQLPQELRGPSVSDVRRRPVVEGVPRISRDADELEKEMQFRVSDWTTARRDT